MRHTYRKVIAPTFDLGKYQSKNQWCGYVLECQDNAIYVGMTNCLERRLFEHCTHSKKGDRFTALYPPIRVLEMYVARSKKQAKTWETETQRWFLTRRPRMIVGGMPYSVRRRWFHGKGIYI